MSVCGVPVPTGSEIDCHITTIKSTGTELPLEILAAAVLITLIVTLGICLYAKWS